jgi:dephospho-CoA kinase
METTSDQPAVRIGLTGGIASGKSTVARMFKELGAPLIDTDVIAREVVAPGEPGLAAVRKAFGDDIITDSGELDRAALRERIFRDSDARRRLEKILHPLIRARVIAALKETEAPYVIIAVPLLVETGFNELVDRVLVVDCEPQTQIARLMERDGESRESATTIVNAQAARSDRLAIAHDLVANDGELEATQQQVQSLHHRYLELATVCRARSGRAE